MYATSVYLHLSIFMYAGIPICIHGSRCMIGAPSKVLALYDVVLFNESLGLGCRIRYIYVHAMGWSSTMSLIITGLGFHLYNENLGFDAMTSPIDGCGI